MGTESIQVSGVINVSPERLYNAWLDAVEHSAFTGGEASVEPGVGGRFTAWDGYIQGTTIDLEPARRIVQHWRSTDFPSDSHDSRLEILLEPVPEGTRVTLLHTEIPEGLAAQLEQGWRERYLSPMARYFGVGEETSAEPPPPPVEEEPQAEAPPKKVPAKKVPAKKVPAKKVPAKMASAKKAKPKAKPQKVAKPKPKAKKKVVAKKKSAKKAASKASKPKAAKGRGGKKKSGRR